VKFNSRIPKPAGNAARRRAGSPRAAKATSLTPPDCGIDFVDRPAGLPEPLKGGIEALAGISMDRVKVHYDSSQPAQLQALAYAQGTDIHLAPGQERHLPHEAWHLVQQARGIQPTARTSGGVPVNDDNGLEREADVMGEKARLRTGGATQGLRPDSAARELAAGAAIQRKLNLALPEGKNKFKTEEALAPHEAAIRAAAAKLHPGKENEIWEKLQSWASEWDEDEHPGADEYYEGYEAAVNAAAQALGLTVEIFDPQPELNPRLFIELKDIWAEISRDPTEGHMPSDNLGRLGGVLIAKRDEIGVELTIRFFNIVMPGMNTVIEKFVAGGYDCHQNAAKAARAIFREFKFREFCDSDIPKGRIDTLVAQWEAITFSSQLGE
jgi:hypothetical protein